MGAKDEISRKIQEMEYDYSFDKKEFGKIMIIASLAVLAVSLHALFTLNTAVEQASNSTERLETTAALVGSDNFQQTMDALADTGATIDGQSIGQLIADLEYASNSVEGITELSSELNEAQKTYQWTVLIGILGLVVGITSIYI
jgi:hypothetical protein